MAFLNFLLLILIVGFVLVAVFVFRIYMAIRRAKESLFGKQGKAKHGGSTSYGQRTYSQGRAEQDEIIIDSRPEGQARRKIFTKSEGEYVDFEEEK